MKKEQAFELMNAIPPDLIEEADFQVPAQRRRPKITRMGLIAACLCLALLGTAAAVNYLGVSLATGDDGLIYMQGGVAYVPYDQLSEEIRAIIEEAEGYADSQRVGSWQDAEDLVGIDLMNNPVLDASPARALTAIRGGVTSRFHVEPSKGTIRVYGCFEIGEVDIEVESYLYTEYGLADLENWDNTFLGVRFSDDSEITFDTYTASSGLTAQVIEAYTPMKILSDIYFCVGTVSLHGIPTVVRCQSNVSMEASRAALYQIMDGFLLD